MGHEQIHVDHMRSPIGAYGFRTGTWHVTYQGRPFTLYASIPHNLPLNEQTELVQLRAWRKISAP